MRFLIISWHFPPVASIAALRLGKFAQFLHEAGHDVRVITAAKDDVDRSLSVGIPESLIVSCPWFDLDRIAHPLASRRSRSGSVASQLPPVTGDVRDVFRTWRARLASTYNEVFFFPDRRVGWVPALLRAIDGISREQPPDVIFASGPPFSPFIAAALASRRTGIPWIAEFRDRWIDDPYFPPPRWRRGLDVLLERRIIATASAVVTVSEPWAQFYEQKFGKPTVAVYNGFDALDLQAAAAIAAPAPSAPGALHILHMGTIYPGRRDPSALFAAVRLGNFRPDQVRLVFYGSAAEVLVGLARKLGVEEHLEIRGSVSHLESLAIQRQADILLLMQWANPRELGNIPAKIFEYLAARRPIVGLGYDNGVPAELIRSRQAGLFSNEPEAIARQLAAWLKVKERDGHIPDLPAAVSEGLSRREQFAKLETWVADVMPPRLKQDGTRGAPSARRHRDLLSSPHFRIAEAAGLERPVLCVVIDTEEEFDWKSPFKRTGYALQSIDMQWRAQAIFDRWDVKPVYLLDYPVLLSPRCEPVFRRFFDDGRCEVGVQLHPWVTPPFDEVLGARTSFPCNLPRAIHARKLESLAAAFNAKFGFDPKIHKAGRFGFDESSAELIEDMGYDVDTSVVPHTTFEAHSGPSFHGLPDSPFWFGRRRGVLELPMTCGLAGQVPSDLAGRMWPKLERSAAQLRLRTVLARLRLVERIRLSPEGIDLSAMKRLTRRLLADGHRVFSLSYHSSSLTPGGNPYASSEVDCTAMLERTDRFLRFFFEEVGGRPTTVSELQVILARPRPDQGMLARPTCPVPAA